MAFDRKIKLAIVGTTGLPACYGGFETLAHQLVNELKDEYQITVYCSSKFYPPAKRVKSFNGARLKYFPLNANGYQSIPYDFLSLFHALIFSEIIILLGVSGALLVPFIKLFSRKPIIVNIDGLEWKRAKWKKPVRLFLKWSEAIAVRFSDCVVADNVAIYDYVKKEYDKEAVVIEYGADHVSPVTVTKESMKKYHFHARPYSFMVCRIEPENNIHLILEAFAQNKNKLLVIVGLWNHGIYGKDLKLKYSGYLNIFLLDPIYDQKELNIIRANCSFYIHGHSAGGTNPSLVEAMYLGLPVISFDVAYNRETTENKAKYFSNSDELMQLVSEISDDERKKMGRTLKMIATRRYLWSIISEKYRTQIEIASSKTYEPIPELSMQFSTGSEKSYYNLNDAETF
jgi:glycosyltransferase involved in cell wall biosynthesis